MTLTAVGAVVIALALVSLMSGRLAGAALLGVTIPLSASAAMILGWAGGATVLCSIVAGGAVIARAMGEGAISALRGAPARIGAPGGFLVVFLLVAIIGGYALPRLFKDATQIYAMDRTVVGVADGVMRFPLTSLVPHAGNVTQSVLLTSSVLLFFASASLVRRDTRLPTVILWAATLSQAFFAGLDIAGSGVLEVFRTATYAIAPNQSFAGLTRVIGGATEPSFFGGVSTALCVWHLWRHRLTGRFIHAAGAAAMAALTLASLSSTAIAVLGAAIAIYLAQRLVRSRSMAAFAGAFFLAAGATVAVGWAMLGPMSPILGASADALFLSKMESESGIERAAWAQQALVNFAETSAMGAGLGASRTSGWAMAVLGQTGAPGAILISGFLLTAFARPMPADAAPLRAAALALLAAAMLSASRIDLGPMFFALAGAAVGMSPHRQPAPQIRYAHAHAIV